MSKINTSDTRTVRASIGNDKEFITVADLLGFADHLRDIDAPADANVFRSATDLMNGRYQKPVALHVSYPRDADAPKVTPPADEDPTPPLRNVTSFVVSTRTQGYPDVRVRAHGPGGIWHVETGRVFGTLHLETNNLIEALTRAHEIALKGLPR